MEWLKQQGPWCPALLEYLERNHQQFDVLIFFTYLYAPTVLGLEVAPEKSILVSTAHDEPAIRLEIFKERLQPAGGASPINTDSRAPVPHDAVPDPRARRRASACGVDCRRQQPYPRDRPPDDEPQTGTTAKQRPTIDGRRTRRRRRSRRTWPAAAPCSGAATGCTDRSCCTADASIRARAAKS